MTMLSSDVLHTYNQLIANITGKFLPGPGPNLGNLGAKFSVGPGANHGSKFLPSQELGGGRDKYTHSCIKCGAVFADPAALAVSYIFVGRRTFPLPPANSKLPNKMNSCYTTSLEHAPITSAHILIAGSVHGMFMQKIVSAAQQCAT